jgi:hypothetical protein
MYKELHLSITTACTMSCPHCVYGMFWRTARHTALEQIKLALDWFEGIGKINLTGGEPTCHPQFNEIAEMVRNRFPSIIFGLETNASLYPKFNAALRFFDSIDATLYGPDAWPGCPSNTAKIELLKTDYPALRILKAKHLTFADNRGAHPCGRQARAHWTNGLVYGCCAAPGYKSAIGIDLKTGWHENLKSLRLPCAECVFGQASPI